MIILNEREYAEYCYQHGVLDSKPYNTLSLLSRYFYHCLGYRKKKIIKLLSEFMLSFYERYTVSKRDWDQTFEKLANKAKRYPIHENDGVWITDKELDIIESLDDDVLEKVAFSILCIAKLNFLRNEKSNGWINNSDKEIFDVAGVKCKENDRDDILNKLYIRNIISFPKKNTNLSMQVLIMDKDGDNQLFVPDFRALGNEYLSHKNGGYVRCYECGILIQNNKNGTRKYCKNCNGTIPQENKIIECIDCGMRVVVDSKNNKTERCDNCYTAYRKARKLETQKARRITKMKSEQTEDETRFS